MTQNHTCGTLKYPVVRPRTWPEWRFVQRKFGQCQWLVGPNISDESLSAVGFKLAGPSRSAASLSPEDQEKLLRLLSKPTKAQTDEERLEEISLLSKCPYGGYMPPVDIDVTHEATKEMIEAARLTIESVLGLEGWGRVRWAHTGGKGVHGDQVAPKDLWSPLLLKAFGRKIQEIAHKAQIPLLTEGHRSKIDRPAIIIDDSLFERTASSRGLMWRLIGAERPETKKKKTALEGQLPCPLPPPQADVEKKLIEILAEETLRPKSSAKKFIRPRPHKELNGKVLQHVFDHLAKNIPASGARHPVRLAVAAWLLKNQVPLDSAAATIAALGDSHDAKAAVDTTNRRLGAGLPTRCTKFLTETMGEQFVFWLGQYFHKDMTEHKVPFADLKRYLTTDERNILKAAGAMGRVKADAFARHIYSQLPPIPPQYTPLGRIKKYPKPTDEFMAHHNIPAAVQTSIRGLWKCFREANTRANACSRAANCGWIEQRDRCDETDVGEDGVKGCGKELRKFRIVAERATCPHCALARARAIRDWCLEKWPEKVTFFVHELQDKSLGAAKAFLKKVRSLINDTYTSNSGEVDHWEKIRRISHKDRFSFFIAPGFVVGLDGKNVDSLLGYAYGEIIGHEGRQVYPHPMTATFKTKAMEAIWPALLARAEYARGLLVAGADAVIEDEWIGNVREIVGGKNRKKLPAYLPSRDEIREWIVAEARAKRNEALGLGHGLAPEDIPVDAETSPCCKKRIVHEILDETGKIVLCAVRGRNWSFQEAVDIKSREAMFLNSQQAILLELQKRE